MPHLPRLHSLTIVYWLPSYVNINRQLEQLYHSNGVVIYIFLTVLFFRRTTPKTQYTGCSVHENNNGQAAFENPMYNTNAKAVEGKAVRFDPNLNTVCTMV